MTTLTLSDEEWSAVYVALTYGSMNNVHTPARLRAMENVIAKMDATDEENLRRMEAGAAGSLSGASPGASGPS